MFSLRVRPRYRAAVVARDAVTEKSKMRDIERRITRDAQCRRVALAHIRARGPDALITMEGDRLTLSGGEWEPAFPGSA